MKTNTKIVVPTELTHEGTRVRVPNPLQELRRSMLACLLWEDQFYEGGAATAKRLATLIPLVDAKDVAQVAIEARSQIYLRHVPLFVVSEMCRYPEHRKFVRATLSTVIQRADELTEFLAIYWKDTTRQKRPLAKSAQRGLADAFGKFSEYDFAKYKGDGHTVSLKDVLLLIHAKPSASAKTYIVAPAVRKPKYRRGPVLRHQDDLFSRVVYQTLQTPDTWEVELSTCRTPDAKRAVWTRLLVEKKLGGLAFLRNLRNMIEVRVDEDLIKTRFSGPFDRVLPFRFITAARYAVRFEPEIERSMLKCLEGQSKLVGKTALIIDTSPSMWMAKVSAKSEMDRFDAAAALAILIREVCDDVRVWAFNKRAYEVPARHGFALRDLLKATKGDASCGGAAVAEANREGYDRIIVLTDGQWHEYDPIRQTYKSGMLIDPKKLCPAPLTKQAYMLNIASYQNGVGYGPWTEIDGWSEHILTYIREAEAPQLQ